jgi:RHS repeat-associated protein
VASSHSYAYNTANQRTRATLADGSYWVYTYDTLGQVTSGQKYWSDGSAVGGQQFDYAFDTIGNRQSITANGNTGTYTANSLNQYTQRSVPGCVWEIGNAASNATVTVNLQPTGRKGQYFTKQLIVDNSSGAVYTQLMTVGVLKNGGSDTNEPDVVTSSTGRVFVTQSPEIFGYDADGNLTNDGRWAYTWDGENRVIQMQTLADLPASVPQEKLLFGYDYQSRRTSKVVSNFNGSAWTALSNLKFIYDGWNLVAELNSTNGVVRSYTWGLDLNGSMRGAGGVGGLLAVNLGINGTHFVAFDGNGNIAVLVDANTGSSSAHYEYGPFGEVTRSTGPMAKSNPFQFSTKYQDDEVGLLYYGYRHLNTSTGRWGSRDPIAERGGLNLFIFCGNDAEDKTDWLGLANNPGDFGFSAFSVRNCYEDTSARILEGLWQPVGIIFVADTKSDFQVTISGAHVYYRASASTICRCCTGDRRAKGSLKTVKELNFPPPPIVIFSPTTPPSDIPSSTTMWGLVGEAVSAVGNEKLIPGLGALAKEDATYIQMLVKNGSPSGLQGAWESDPCQ